MILTATILGISVILLTRVLLLRLLDSHRRLAGPTGVAYFILFLLFWFLADHSSGPIQVLAILFVLSLFTALLGKLYVVVIAFFVSRAIGGTGKSRRRRS